MILFADLTILVLLAIFVDRVIFVSGDVPILFVGSITEATKNPIDLKCFLIDIGIIALADKISPSSESFFLKLIEFMF